MAYPISYAKSRTDFRQRGDIVIPYNTNDMFTPYDNPTFTNATMTNENNYIDKTFGYKANSQNHDYAPSPEQDNKFYPEESENIIYNKIARLLFIDPCELTPLFKMYFGKENIRRIQKNIKQEVLTRSKGKYKLVVDLELDELLPCMSDMYTFYAKNLPTQLVRQTKVLNKILLDTIMPEIVSNIQQQYGYLKDVTQPRQLVNLPVNMNSAGRKQLKSVTSIWGF